MDTRVLLTGFDPFGDEELNASGEVVEKLKNHAPAGVEVTVRVLPTDFTLAPRVLKKTVESTDPDLVMCLGQAQERFEVTPERVAINIADTRRTPDNAGRQPKDEPVIPGGPPAYWSTLPVREIAGKRDRRSYPGLRDSGASIEYGWDVRVRPGLCSLIHMLATQRYSARGGFIHVPVLPEQAPDGQSPSMALDDTVRAVKLAIKVTCVQRGYAPWRARRARSHHPRTSALTSISSHCSGAYQPTLSALKSS